jgi:ribulose-phosphate 3-epimerase
MIEIIPGILTDDPNKAREMLGRVEGVAKRVHIDIMDGHFVDNKTIYPDVLHDIDGRTLIDYHLMVKEPLNWLEKCIKGNCDRAIGHIELMQSQRRYVEKCQELGMRVGLAIDLNTPIFEIDEEVLSDLDVILVMSVKAGFGGQEFSDKAIDKLHELGKLRSLNDYKYKICDDGGVTFDKIDDIHDESVDQVVIGNRIFEGDLAENIKKYIEAAYK